MHLSISISIIFLGLNIIAHGQDTLKYEHVQKGNIKPLKKGNEYTAYELKDGSVIKLGDTLIIGNPSSNASGTMQTGNVLNSSITNNIYSFILVGKWSMNILAGGPLYLQNGAEGVEIIIKDIKARRVGMAKNAPTFETMTASAVKFNNANYTLSSIDKAIELGEIINPKGTMTKTQALKKLKEAKDLLDLGLMFKDDYEALKEKLGPIILKKED